MCSPSEGEWGHLRPGEVVVLAVEVTLACAPRVVVDDVAFGAAPVVGYCAAVHVFRPEYSIRLRARDLVGDGRALDHKPLAHLRQHNIEPEGGDTAMLTTYACLRLARILRDLGVPRSAVVCAFVGVLAMGGHNSGASERTLSVRRITSEEHIRISSRLSQNSLISITSSMQLPPYR